MGFLTGRVVARRFKVVGQVQTCDPLVYHDQIINYAFVEPPSPQKETEGWTRVDDPMEVDLSNSVDWATNDLIALGLRVDKRVLPKVFKSDLRKAYRRWSEENGVARCPRAVRDEIKDTMEDEYMRRVFPRTQHYQLVWNTSTGIARLSSHSDDATDRVRKRFYRTFGLRLMPWSPLEWLRHDPEVVAVIMKCPPTSLVAGKGEISVDADLVDRAVSMAKGVGLNKVIDIMKKRSQRLSVEEDQE